MIQSTCVIHSLGAVAERRNPVSNNERFNDLINSCAHARQVYNALLSLAEPGLQQTDDMGQKRQIIDRQLLSLLDQAQSNQQMI